MIAAILGKFAAPALLGAALGIGGVIGIQKATRQDIKLECPVIDYDKFPKCPVCPPTLGNELEKVKGKYVTVNLHQNLYIQMETDTMILKKIGDEVEARLQNLKVSRCK
jgi:hypothetical protein